MIYIKEAHASDGWVSRSNEREGIQVPNHRTYDDRVKACTLTQSKLEIKMPALIDGMDDAVNRAYSGWPDRVYLLDKEGRIVIKGERGPRGFTPSVEDAEDWLQARFDDEE